MTKAELLLDVIGEAQDYYVEELDEWLTSPKKRRRWIKPLVAAACVVLVSVTAVFGVRFFLSFGSNCGGFATEGICAGGYFYYEVQDDGIYRYTPEKGAKRIVGNRSFWNIWNNSWYQFTANDDALYYAKGDTIYRIAHDSTKSEILYRAEGTAEIGELYPAGAHDITAYIYDNNARVFEKKIIIDGATGEIKSAADKISYTVGDYTYDIIRENDGLEGYSYGLYRNGIRLLDQNDHVEPLNVQPSGDCLILTLGRNGQGFITSPSRFLIIRPDGTMRKVFSGYRFDPQGNGSYFYYLANTGDDEGSIIAIDADDDAQTVLITPEELRQYDILTSDVLNDDDYEDMLWVYELYSDGEYLYLSNGYDKIMCFSIVYDNGVPKRIELVDDNITN